MLPGRFIEAGRITAVGFVVRVGFGIRQVVSEARLRPGDDKRAAILHARDRGGAGI